MDIFLHIYGKSHRPGRKIGLKNLTTFAPSIDLEALANSLVTAVDRMRQLRLLAASNLDKPPTTSQSSFIPSPPSSDTRHPLVVTTMGSDSSLPILKPAFEILERFNVPFGHIITSAHRTLHRMVEHGKSAVLCGVRVLIGGSAHLLGMLATETTVPVIGISTKMSHLDGHNSLLSIAQMLPGCLIVTFGINNSTNAALLAIKILGSTDVDYRLASTKYMKEMSDGVEAKASRLQNIGWKAYLEEK